MHIGSAATTEYLVQDNMCGQKEHGIKPLTLLFIATDTLYIMS